MKILETRNLTKHYGSRRVLNDVTLSMEEGAVYGLLGPNGAGKTTFLRLVNNIIVRDAGEILFRGKPLTHATGRLLGYMPEERGLYAKMRMDEQILFFGQLKGGDKRRLTEVMHEYMDIFSISKEDSKRKVQELSKGNQQKVQIISTLVHEPQLVMLDEPFSGFDPINGALLTSLIQRLRSKGTTIVLSSHNMAAVEEMCSEIALINAGELLLHGSIHDIKNSNRDNRIVIKTATPVDFADLKQKEIITEAILHERTSDAPFTYTLHTSTKGCYNDIALTACRQSTLLGLEEKLPSLNELFIKYTNAGRNGSAPLIDNEFEKI